MDVGRSFSFWFQLQSKHVQCIGALMSAKRVFWCKALDVFKDTVFR